MTKPKDPTKRRVRIYLAGYHCKDLIKRRSKGQLNAQICSQWHISENTFYRWIKEHPEFKEAHEESMQNLKASWVDRGINYMDEGNSKAFPFWKEIMKNELDYISDSRAKTEVTQKNQLYIGNVNLIQNGDKDYLLSFIKDELRNLKDVIDLTPSQIEWIDPKEDPEN